MELWKDIKGYEERYQISNHGRVKSLERRVKAWVRSGRLVRERILKQQVHFCGIRRVCLRTRPGISKHHRVGVLVAAAFILNPSRRTKVNHIDSDISNNKVENLEWNPI